MFYKTWTKETTHTHIYIKFQLKEQFCNWLVKIDLAKTQHTHTQRKKEKKKNVNFLKKKLTYFETLSSSFMFCKQELNHNKKCLETTSQ